MGIGASLFLIAIGAILAWAVEIDTPGFNLNTIGIILLVVGIIGAVMSMIFWSTWGGWSNRRETYVRDRDVVRERDVV
jgi:hypothetical protein